MLLIFLLLVAFGVGLFFYIKSRAERAIDEAWTTFKDRTPIVRGYVVQPPSSPQAGRMIPYTPETYRSFDEAPSAYVRDVSTGYTQPVTESILSSWSASETSSCSYDSGSSYSDSSSYSSCDSGSSSCSCD